LPIGTQRCERVLDEMCDQVTDRSWIPSSASKVLRLVEEERFERVKADFLDSVPVMSETVLGLEMLMHEPFIDLRRVSAIVLSDVGATLHILRLIGRECPFAAEFPSRMDDCLASLDAGAWFNAMCTRTFACDRQHSAVTAVWKHCRLVAQYAQLVAESIEGVTPEDAYLVGLLHEIESIPRVLGWPNSRSGASAPVVLSGMEGSLPLFVLAAVRSALDSSPSSIWKPILTAAHELAGARGGCESSKLRIFESVEIDARWKGCSPAIADCISVAP
jgi:hypothetical protein